MVEKICRADLNWAKSLRDDLRSKAWPDQTVTLEVHGLLIAGAVPDQGRRLSSTTVSRLVRILDAVIDQNEREVVRSELKRAAP